MHALPPASAMISPPIIGHSRQCSELMEDLKNGSLAHAYLFVGKKHLGKFSVAKWFAAEILSAGKDDESKERIQSQCKKNMHPDLLTLDQLWIDEVCTDWNVIAKSSSAPQQHRMKTKAKTDTIGIDDVRALQERLYETPQGSHTICLIRSIERLHITAANAFLKILEEPPPHVLFCFTTESIGGLPQTIVSRMRTVNFFPVSNTELEPIIAESSSEDRALLLGIAGGAPGIIIRCLHDTEHFRMQRQVHIDTHHFYEDTSILSRCKRLVESWESDESSALFFRQLLLRLSAEMRGEKRGAEKAAMFARNLFTLLRSLETNTNKDLLAASSALSL